MRLGDISRAVLRRLASGDQDGYLKTEEGCSRDPSRPIDEDETACALLSFAGDELAQRTPEQQAVAMIAAARGYHKREDEPRRQLRLRGAL